MESKEIFKALVKAQLEIKPPVKDSFNKGYGSKYCSIDAIYDAIRKPLADNGLFITHSVEILEGAPLLRTAIIHVSGDTISNLVPVKMEKATSQGVGSALTYARRYGIACLLGLPSDEDDDGHGLLKDEDPQQHQKLENKRHPLSIEDKAKIIKASRENGELVRDKCKEFYQCDSLDAIRVINTDQVTKFLMDKMKEHYANN